MPIRFKDWNCEIQKAHYSNGRTAIRLVDAQDGGPVATASLNMPNVPLAEDEVLVKDHAENEGMLSALEQAGIVQPTGRVVVSGFVQVPVCRVVGKL